MHFYLLWNSIPHLPQESESGECDFDKSYLVRIIPKRRRKEYVISNCELCDQFKKIKEWEVLGLFLNISSLRSVISLFVKPIDSWITL